MPLRALWCCLLLSCAPANARENPSADPGIREAPDSSLSPHDELILKEAGYSVEKGSASFSGRPLKRDELRGVLDSLRRQRRDKRLADIARLREALGADEAERLRGQVARDWPLFSSSEREDINRSLEEAGREPIRSAGLGRVRAAVRQWNDRSAEVAGGSKPMGGTVAPEPRGSAAEDDEDEEETARAPGARRAPGTRAAGRAAPRPAAGEFAPPDAREFERRKKEIEAATYIDPKTRKPVHYSKEAQDILIEAVRYASDKDAEAVLRTLKNVRPLIEIDNGKMLPALSGFADFGVNLANPADKRNPRVVIIQYHVWIRNPLADKDPTAPKRIQLAAGHTGMLKKLGIAVPEIDAIREGVSPVSVQRRKDGTLLETFADGSSREFPSPRSRAGLVLHEMLHLDTAGSGMGANMFANEMRSFTAMNRTFFNMGVRAPSLDLWLNDPAGYRSRILQIYTGQMQSIEPDETTVESQLTKTDRLLSLSGQEFAQARSRWIRRQVEQRYAPYEDFIRYEVEHGLISHKQAEQGRQGLRADMERQRLEDERNLDYRAYLLRTRERLLKDRELEQKVMEEDRRWHEQNWPSGLSSGPGGEGG